MHKHSKEKPIFQLRTTKRLFPGTLHHVHTVKGETKVKMLLKKLEIREIAENSAFLDPSKFYPKPNPGSEANGRITRYFKYHK